MTQLPDPGAILAGQGGYNAPVAPPISSIFNTSAMTLPNGNPNAPGPTTLPNGNPNAAPQTSNLVSYSGGTLTPQQAASLAMQAGFQGSALVDIVAIMGRESGYSPTAQNPISGAIGLTQINWSQWPNLIPLMNSLGYQPQSTAQAVQMLTNPLTNLRVAYAVTNGGTDFSDWMMENGQPDSYLQSTDVTTAQAVVQQVTGQIYQPTTSWTMGNSMAAAAQAGSAQGFTLDMNDIGAGPGTPGSTDASGAPTGNTTLPASVQKALQSALNYTPTSGQFDPGQASSAISALNQAIMSAIAANPEDAYFLGPIIAQTLPLLQSFDNLGNNIYVDPQTGEISSFSKLTPQQQAYVNQQNATAYNTIKNTILNQNWTNLSGAITSSNTALSNQFSNQISAFGQKIAAGDLSLQQASDQLQRWMDAQNTAQNLTQDVQAQQQQVEQWGTPTGQASFTPNDLGMGALAKFSGQNPNATALAFPGTQNVNAIGKFLSSPAALGAGALPGIPNVTNGVTANDVPVAPNLNSNYPITNFMQTNPPPPTGIGAAATPSGAGAVATGGLPPNAAGFLAPPAGFARGTGLTLRFPKPRNAPRLRGVS